MLSEFHFIRFHNGSTAAVIWPVMPLLHCALFCFLDLRNHACRGRHVADSKPPPTHPPAASFKFKHFSLIHYSFFFLDLPRNSQDVLNPLFFFFLSTQSLFPSLSSLLSSLFSSDRDEEEAHASLEGGGSTLTRGSHPAVARARY
jgi:hypothetical protein